jgi:hypothetical protein
MRSSRTHLSPTPISRSIGAASSAIPLLQLLPSSTGSINPPPTLQALYLPRQAPRTQRPRRSPRQGAEAAGFGTERRAAAHGGRDEMCLGRAARLGTCRWRGGVLYYILQYFFFASLFAELDELVRDTTVFRFVSAFFLGQEGIHDGSRSRGADLVCNARSAVPGYTETGRCAPSCEVGIVISCESVWVA